MYLVKQSYLYKYNFQRYIPLGKYKSKPSWHSTDIMAKTDDSSVSGDMETLRPLYTAHKICAVV